MISGGRLVQHPGVPLRSEQSVAAWSTENTNGVLQQYFSKVTDPSATHSSNSMSLPMRLNRRPRQTLGFQIPQLSSRKLFHRLGEDNPWYFPRGACCFLRVCRSCNLLSGPFSTKTVGSVTLGSIRSWTSRSWGTVLRPIETRSPNN